MWLSLPASFKSRSVKKKPLTKIVFIVSELSSEVVLRGPYVHTNMLLTLPPRYNGPPNFAADLAFYSDEMFVYLSNRGHDSIAYFKFVSDEEDVRDDTDVSLGPNNYLEYVNVYLRPLLIIVQLTNLAERVTP